MIRKYKSMACNLKTLLTVSCIMLVSASLFGQAVTEAIPDTSYFKGGKDDMNLIEAVMKTDTSAVKLLLERGADPNAKSAIGNSALIHATGTGNIHIMMMLVNKGADVNFSGYNQETPLFTAIFHNDFQAAKYLLEQGADPNVKDAYGVTPLIYAAATNQYQSADLLMFYGADEEKRDTHGNDPLIAAVTFEHIETSDVLLQNELDPDVQDKKGNTPLIVATQHGTYGIIDLLLDYNADPNIANKKNYTPLAYAVVYEDTIAMNMLLERGADINHKITKGRNITELARVTRNKDVLDLAKSRGGKPLNHPDFSEFHFISGHSFNSTDYLIQFRGALVDTRYGYFAETGVDYRPFLLRYQVMNNDTLYQFRERRIGWSHGIGKYFTLVEEGKTSFSAYGSVNGYLSFPRYAGSEYGKGISYRVIPSAGLSFSWYYLGIKAGVDWYRFGNMLEKGLKYNVSVFLRLVQPEDHYDRKEIYWE